MYRTFEHNIRRNEDRIPVRDNRGRRTDVNVERRVDSSVSDDEGLSLLDDADDPLFFSTCTEGYNYY